MPVQFLMDDGDVVEPSDFVKWLREKCPSVADEILKNLTVSGVHQTTALGNEDEEEREAQSIDQDKRKQKTRRTIVSALEGNDRTAAKPIDADKRNTGTKEPGVDKGEPSETNYYIDGQGNYHESPEYYEDPDQIGDDLTRYFAGVVEKLKVKLKLECTPAELKQLRGLSPAQYLSFVSDAEDKAEKGEYTAARNSRDVAVMRHGATHLNNNDTSVDRIRGWLDVPLSEEGQQEAAKLAKKMAKNPPDHLVCSDLKRAHETAKMVADACNMDIAIVSQGFRPWNVGDLAGQSSKTAVPILVDYATNKQDQAVPGGESFNDFRQRFMGALSDALDQLPGSVGMVAHHRNERLLTAWAAAGYPTDGTIDGKEFAKKGEGTAGHEWVKIPADRLAQAAVAPTTKWVNAPSDLTKVFETTIRRRDEEFIEKEEENYELHVTKVDREQQLVFGIWSVTTMNGIPVVDKQDDIIPTPELETAVYNWVLKSRTQGEMHDEMDVGRCVESMMYTMEKQEAINSYFGVMGTGGTFDARMEFWWGGFKVDNAHTWELIKAGRLPEFSIGGAGRRTEAPPDTVAAKVMPSISGPPAEPVTVNVSVAPARHKTIKMHRDESGNLIADITESE